MPKQVAKKSRLEGILKEIDVSKQICNHLVGEEHTMKHRRMVGICIIIVGVLVSNIEVRIVIIRLIIDGIAPFIHAVGCIPFLDSIQSKKPDSSTKS